MRILVSILTSYDIELLKRAIESVKNQYKINIEYDTKIIVNTLKEGYYEQVKELYENEYEVIETESNGSPGKGHNSVLNLFEKYTQYSHLITIDGDDLFYPCAFQQLVKAIDSNVDILHLMINDYVSFIKKEIRHVDLKGKFRLYSSFDDEQNWWNSIKVKNPLKNPIHVCKTPARIIFCSRKIFDTNIKITYDEECTLYDDYIAFLSLCENYFENKLNVVATSNSYIYCYNAVNPESASRRFKKEKEESIIFKEKAKKYSKTLESFGTEDNWNLKKLKFQKFGKPDNFNLQKKKIFCNKHVIDFEIEFKNKKADKFYDEKNYEQALIYYSILLNSGITRHQNYFNLGVIWYHKKKYENAVGYFLKAASITPTFDAYKNLVVIYKDLNSKKKQIEYLQKALAIKDDMYLRMHLFNLLPLKEIKTNNVTLLSKNVKTTTHIKPILCYYAGYSDPFNGKNYQERNVYGSEISAIKLCEQFTKYYTVFIFCVCKEEIIHNGVRYQHISKYTQFQNLYPIDILIVSRFIHFFLEFRCLAKKVYYLLHDARVHNYWKDKSLIDCGSPMFHNLISNFNKIVCVSDWHKHYFCNFVKVPTNYVQIIPNGFESKNFNVDFSKKIKNRFIYCSDPDRGLIILLKMFPKILEMFPDATLDIYFHKIKNPTILDLINNAGEHIKFKGKLKQSDLAKELCKSDIWFYPNLYSHETFCLCALEAMAGGNLVIARKYSGLVQTIGDSGILIDEHTPEKFEVESLKIIKKVLNNQDTKRNFQKLAIKRANIYKWETISKMWYSLFNQ
jgi:glycosyltransferase involved in cell wall biosynthesis